MNTSITEEKKRQIGSVLGHALNIPIKKPYSIDDEDSKLYSTNLGYKTSLGLYETVCTILEGNGLKIEPRE